MRSLMRSLTQLRDLSTPIELHVSWHPRSWPGRMLGEDVGSSLSKVSSTAPVFGLLSLGRD